MKSIVFMVVIGLLAGCENRGTSRPRPDIKSLETVSLESLQITPGDDGVAFQYFKPGSAKAVAVTDPAKIPEKLRTNVIVLYRDDRRDQLPAKALVLADLTQLEDGAHPIRIVNRYEHRSPAPAASPAPQAGQNDVLLYTAPGCGHCTRARNWLKNKNIPFTEKDISRDPAAAGEIRARGKAQGLPDSYLTGVPLLNVKGKVLVGFDPAQVEAALK